MTDGMWHVLSCLDCGWWTSDQVKRHHVIPECPACRKDRLRSIEFHESEGTRASVLILEPLVKRYIREAQSERARTELKFRATGRMGGYLQ